MTINQYGSTDKRNRDDKKADHQKKKQITPTNQQRSSISLTDLPSNVLVEILVRLPLKTFFVARSVCKTFVFLTTNNPHFINLHTSSNAAQIPVFQFKVSQWPSRLIHVADNVFNYKKSQLRPLFQLPKIDGTVKEYKSTNFWDIGWYSLVNSCNGLLYIRQIGPEDSLSLVCNPVTSEYLIIPGVLVDPKMMLHSWTESFYLGFSPGDNQYKVLRTFCWEDDVGTPECATQVFVIGSDSWRDIDYAPFCRRYFTLNLYRTQYVNGVMYWHDGMSWQIVIISFDFEREKFGEVALPLELQDEGFIRKHETSIGVLGGCLCLSCNNFDDHRVDLWVMRKYGNQESWTKDFVIDTVGLRVKGWPIYGQFKPVQFLGNGEILMQWTLLRNNWRENALVCYDPRTGTLTYFVFDGVIGDYKVMALTPSFVPLKDALKVDKVFSGLRPRGDQVAIINILGFRSCS